MNHLANLLGAIALIFWGTYMVKSGMLRTFGVSLRAALCHGLDNRFKGFCAGFGLSSLLQSSTAATLLIAGLQSEGLVNTLIAISSIFGAELGSAFVACVLSLNFSILAPILILAGVIIFFRFKPTTRQGQFGRILLGLAFIMIAINQIVISTAPLRSSADLAPFFELLHDHLILSFAAGMLLAVLCVSSLAAVIIASSMAISGVLSFEAALWMVLGANAGSTLLSILTTSFASTLGRRGPWAAAVFRTLLIVLALIALSFGLSSKVALPENVVLCHLLFNAILGACGLVFVKPLSHWAQWVLPDNHAFDLKTFDNKQLFVQENFLSVSISLGVAKKHILKEFDELKDFWLSIDSLLADNPSPGDVMLLHHKKEMLLKFNSSISVFLNSAVKANVTSREAFQWQNLKSVNGSLKAAINLTDHVIEVLDSRKCQKHLDFSPEGLKELRQSHQMVLACINTLGAYLTAHNARERTQRSALLAERQKQILSFAHDQTRLHLQRIADNNSLSIETSALHLEILSLFNRMANLVCACANLEVERN